MKKENSVFNGLPELPVQLFELSGKLEYSETAPVITVKPNAVRAGPLAVVAHSENKSSYTITQYFVWIIYPHVVCYPPPDLTVLARMKMENTKPDLLENESDLRAIAGARRYYKLSKIHGIELTSPFGCVVRYGPWTAFVTRTESCIQGQPNRWELSSSVIDMNIQWYGEWEDIPTVPNLTVVMGTLTIGGHTPPQCCGGYNWCPTTGSCISDQLNCKDNIPL